MGRIPTSGTINVTNLSPMEPIDLETELIATAVPKPNMLNDKKPMSVISKKGNFDPNQPYMDDDDPDYVPPKNLKLN